MNAPTNSLLKIKNLKTQLHTNQGLISAVDGLSLDIRKRETVALLGESGCGKTLTALSIMRLLPKNGNIPAGSIHFDGIDLLSISESDMRKVRGKRISMIFQESSQSLDPLMVVGKQVESALRQNTKLTHTKIQKRIVELLDAVGIPDPKKRQFEYPHQLSGGIKQRVLLAIAIAGEPELLIADEPTTALDVTIQAQLLDLIRDLQHRIQMSMLLVTHDLGVASGMAHRIAVMYAGEIVEMAPRDHFFSRPAHPYSIKLFSAVPNIAKRDRKLAVIKGSVPSLTEEFTGCRFAERCDNAWELCHYKVPDWINISTDHYVRCHLWNRSNKSVPSDIISPKILRKYETEGNFYNRHNTTLLEVDHLKVYYPVRTGLLRRVTRHVKAVDGISLAIKPGLTLALVGESGCGKTTAAKAILGLIPSFSGQITLNGSDILSLNRSQLRRKRREFQIIF